MTKLEKAARGALEALEICVNAPMWDGKKNREAITALREALGYCIDEGCPHRENTHTCINPIAEQAEQKPVAWWDGKETAFFEHELCGLIAPAEFHTPLYAVPVRTKDLTDDEIGELIMPVKPIMEFARAVIAAYKEKNK